MNPSPCLGGGVSVIKNKVKKFFQGMIPAFTNKKREMTFLTDPKQGFKNIKYELEKELFEFQTQIELKFDKSSINEFTFPRQQNESPKKNPEATPDQPSKVEKTGSETQPKRLSRPSGSSFHQLKPPSTQSLIMHKNRGKTNSSTESLTAKAKRPTALSNHISSDSSVIKTPSVLKKKPTVAQSQIELTWPATTKNAMHMPPTLIASPSASGLSKKMTEKEVNSLSLKQLTTSARTKTLVSSAS